jgi:hypothetical protein
MGLGSHKKGMWALAALVSLAVSAQDVGTLFKEAADATYDPRVKGLRDLVVEMESPTITKQLNDQMIFGKVQEVVFRAYWTAEPERVGMEIEGLPEGFREVKEELKLAMVARLEHILPPPWERRYPGYQPKTDPAQPKVILFENPTGYQTVLAYEVRFDMDYRPRQVVAKRASGLVTTTLHHARESWSEGRYVLVRSETSAEEGPQRTTVLQELTYQSFAGVGLPVLVKTATKQTLQPPGAKPQVRTFEDVLTFKNHRVNSGAALSWFQRSGKPAK